MKRTQRWYQTTFSRLSEPAKLRTLKACILGLMLMSLIGLNFGASNTSDRLAYAGGFTACVYFYLNLFKVRFEVAALYEPPYDYDGNTLSLISFALIVASIYDQFS